MASMYILFHFLLKKFYLYYHDVIVLYLKYPISEKPSHLLSWSHYVELLKIDNAEVRREFVRKVGIDRVCYSLGAQCIDKVGNYELLLLDLQDGRKRPYLKMLNPSIDTWHVEGVHPNCQTVEQALKWRNQSKLKPKQLT